jgi:hypothetical protein
MDDRANVAAARNPWLVLVVLAMRSDTENSFSRPASRIALPFHVAEWNFGVAVGSYEAPFG